MIAEPPVAPTLPAEPTTTMKPSEALRLGALLVDAQAFGQMYAREFDPNGGVAQTRKVACAMGAIALARGLDPLDGRGPFEGWPDRTVPSPCAGVWKVDHALNTTSAHPVSLVMR